MRFTLLLLIQISLFGSVAFAQQKYYTVTFPNDTTIYECGGVAPVVQPTITTFGGCNFGVGVSYKDHIFYLNGSQNCYKVARRWRLHWWCDYDPNNMMPEVIPNPPNTDQGPTVDGTPFNHGYLEYTQIIKVLDGDAPIITDCPDDQDFCDITNNDPQLWNAPYWWDVNTNMHDLCERPVDLQIAAFDSCTGTDLQVRYILLLDLNNDGIMESVVSSTNPPDPGTIAFDNIGNPNYSGGKIRTFDFRNVLNAEKYQFAVETGIDSTTGDFTAAVRWNSIANPDVFVVPELPLGNHKIKWIVEDGCGNQATCEYAFTIKDCKPPTVVCLNGLSANLMPTGMVTLADTSFIEYFYDNCTPNDQIEIGIRKAGAGTGFPVNSHTVTFDCAELGQQEVEVWAIDADGNADFCLTYVQVQDNQGACGPSSKFGGNLKTASGQALQNVPVYLLKHNQMMSMAISDPDGNYLFDPQNATCLVVAPDYDTLASQGMNTLDVLLTALHAADLKQLDDPYKQLAADVDGNGVIDQNDLLPMIQVLLGGADQFPGQASWQFVPAGHVFADPANPFDPAVPNVQTVCLTPGAAPVVSFIGVKTGDINGSVNNIIGSADDRKGYTVFTAEQRRFQAGQTFTIPVWSPDLDGLTGFQMALGYDREVLELVQVEPRLVPQDWTVTNTDDATLATSWHSVEAYTGTAGKNAKDKLFELTFTAKQEGVLSNHLYLDAAALAPEAYSAGLQTTTAELVFKLPKTGREAFRINSVWPNPAQDRILLEVEMPEASDLQLRWTNVNGSIVGQESFQVAEGVQTIELSVPQTQSAVLMLHADSRFGSEVQRVVIKKN